MKFAPVAKHFFSQRLRWILIGGFTLLILAGGVARAQEEAAQIETQQGLAHRYQDDLAQQQVQFRISEPDLGDIDLVVRQPRPKMFSFSTNQSFNYTSNAFLVSDGEQDTVFWNGRFDASFVPYSTRNFTPRLTFEQDFFRYDKYSQLDFDSQSLQLSLKYDLTRDHSWFVDGSYAGARLYSPKSRIGEFYKYGLLTGSITHIFPFRQQPLFLAGTLGSYWRQGESSAFDRIAPYLNLALLYSPVEKIQMSAFLRPEVQFYTNDPMKSSRTDLNINLGGSVSWIPIEYVSLGAAINFVGNYSNLGPAKYNLFSPAAILSAQIAF
jgi:hypothetical protein